MNELLHELMREATALTRQGQLHQATHAIQRALQGGAAAGRGREPAAAAPPSFRPGAGAAGAASDPLVLDGLTRVIETPLGPEPEPEPAGAPAPVGERWTDGTFTHQGRSLAYKLYLPPRADGDVSARPMVVMLHGCTQGAADFAAGTQMNDLARDLGMVVLYPEQTQRANAQKCWNWFKPQHQQRGRGEPALLAALAQSVSAAHHVDPARVFVAGLSAGGAMADIVGRCYPDVFAAVGIHSGLPTGAANDVMTALSAMRSGSAMPPAAAARPAPPTIVFHGDADATVHARNGAAIIEAACAATARATGSTPSTRVVQGRSSQGNRFTRTVFTDDTGRSTAEYWQLHGAGHAWSGGSASGSYTDPAGADASSEMLRFFLAHPRRG